MRVSLGPWERAIVRIRAMIRKGADAARVRDAMVGEGAQEERVYFAWVAASILERRRAEWMSRPGAAEAREEEIAAAVANRRTRIGRIVAETEDPPPDPFNRTEWAASDPYEPPDYEFDEAVRRADAEGVR